MKKTLKKVLAFTLAAALTFGSAVTTIAAAPSPTTGKVPIVQTANSDDGLYTVKTTKKGTATIVAAKTKKKKMVVPSTIAVNGVNYKVTTIGKQSLKKWTNVKKITLANTVKSVNKQAFKNCKKLKTVIVKNTKSIKFAKKAFKGLNTKKITVKCSKKMSAKNFKKVQANLKKIGFKGKVKRG